jgi:hypothetical protein
MFNSSFIKSLTEFLEDRTDAIDFKETSQKYQERDNNVDKIFDQIRLLLDEHGQRILTNLDDETSFRMTVASEIAYQKGFSEGIKLIIYSLIMSEDNNGG